MSMPSLLATPRKYGPSSLSFVQLRSMKSASWNAQKRPCSAHALAGFGGGTGARVNGFQRRVMVLEAHVSGQVLAVAGHDLAVELLAVRAFKIGVDADHDAGVRVARDVPDFLETGCWNFGKLYVETQFAIPNLRGQFEFFGLDGHTVGLFGDALRVLLDVLREVLGERIAIARDGPENLPSPSTVYL